MRTGVTRMVCDILEQVLKSPKLSSLPAIALEVINLVQQTDVNIR